MIQLTLGSLDVAIKLHGVSGNANGHIILHGTRVSEMPHCEVKIDFPPEQQQSLYTALGAIAGWNEYTARQAGFWWGIVSGSCITGFLIVVCVELLK